MERSKALLLCFHGRPTLVHTGTGIHVLCNMSEEKGPMQVECVECQKTGWVRRWRENILCPHIVRKNVECNFHTWPACVTNPGGYLPSNSSARGKDVVHKC